MLTSIKSALASMFAVLAVVTGIQGVITVRQLQHAEADVKSIAEQQLPSLGAIQDVSNAVLSIRAGEFRLVLSNLDDKVIENNLIELEADRRDFQAARGRYEPLIGSDDERRNYEKLSTTLDSYMRLTASLPGLMRAKQAEQAQQLLMAPWLRVLFSSADTQLRNAILLHQSRAHANLRNSVAVLTHAKVVALVSSIAAACLAALAITVSHLRFLRPLGIVTRALNQLAHGNVGAGHVPSRRRDEIGAISQAVEVFRASLIRARRAETERARSQLFVENIAASTPDGILAFDDAGAITFCNQAAEIMLGTHAVDLMTHCIKPAVSLGALPSEDFPAIGPDPRGRTIETEILGREGGMLPVELSYSQWRQDGRLMSCAILRDIGERKRNEAVLNHMAHSDALTGLPNRLVLTARMGEALRAARPLTVLLLDLDHFKQINDIFGHQVGDGILKITAERLLACTARGDTVTRIGGDEFTVVIDGQADPLRAAATAETIIDALSQPFLLQGQTIHLGASVGITLAPLFGTDPDELMSSADLALYAAKAQGRHVHRLFTPDMRNAAVRDSLCRQELPRAIERAEFVLFYQPQVRLTDGAIIGAEALIRWQHPDFGLIPPDRFIPILEASHLAEEVGDWVIQTACAQAAQWRRIWPDFRMGVNLSGAHFQSGHIADTVSRILQDTGLPGSALEVEITEHIILRHDEQIIAPLHELRRLGVSIAFDDYGTGYASLSLLKRFPLDRLKIDRSFVQTILESETDAAIVSTVLSLGARLGLSVIAEGVETEGQAERLRQKGCVQAQGYLFGRPLPPDSFEARFAIGVDGERLRA
ncbi:EAL domain-containing protein [Lichenihabitans sp. Uapishka_5]|uniref:EAL domain-containing protein n=1 Tax=Lichenihabitans sp. Uapishka_5 TaxID=3037302 RepID=UPI0029E8086C|nr:EAL domain-containing protein [Lichenihabitans sp. Uapishka_5]MDX7951205.1 EAL domain-containing protein [Lichenihabitans sp. Uapishka_5]